MVASVYRSFLWLSRWLFLCSVLLVLLVLWKTTWLFLQKNSSLINLAYLFSDQRRNWEFENLYWFYPSYLSLLMKTSIVIKLFSLGGGWQFTIFSRRRNNNLPLPPPRGVGEEEEQEEIFLNGNNNLLLSLLRRIRNKKSKKKYSWRIFPLSTIFSSIEY